MRSSKSSNVDHEASVLLASVIRFRGKLAIERKFKSNDRFFPECGERLHIHGCYWPTGCVLQLDSTFPKAAVQSMAWLNTSLHHNQL